MALFPSKTRKGFGLIFQEGQSSTFGLERMRLASHAAPTAFRDHEEATPIVDGERFVFDQQATSSCVANAFLHAVILKEAREGLEFEELARLYPHWFSRWMHNSQWWDGGTYLHTMADALRKFGCPPERDWKWGQFSTRVNRRPNWNALRNAHARRGGRYVRIYETQRDRIQAVQQALMNGHDVAFGTRLAKSFLAPDGDALIKPPGDTDEIAGNHAMLIIGWATFNGVLYFRVLNSWGRFWRDRGLCWMRSDYITAAYTRDLHIVYGWSKLREQGE